MKQLITPAEVIAIAFGSTNALREESIPAVTILAAQQRLVRPVVGERLYEMFTAEEPEEPCRTFVEAYLKAPLALYVASLVLPQLAVQVGSAGVVRFSGEGFEAADEGSLRRAARRLRKDAEALMDAATDRLAREPLLAEHYSPEENVRTRVTLAGGIVL